MPAVKRTLVDPKTYRGLGYLLSGIPLGLIWFTALVTLWSLCLGLAITPLSIPLVIVLAYATRGFAAVEAELARSLLGAEARAPAAPLWVGGFWASLRALFGADFWRAQAYLMTRWFVGFPVGIAVFSLLVASFALICSPVWVPLVHGGVHLGFWRPHTFAQSLALVPAGLVLLPASLLLVKPLAEAFRAIAGELLRGEQRTAGRADTAGRPVSAVRPRRASRSTPGWMASCCSGWC